MKYLETNRLVIRPWTLSNSDRTVFHRIMSDELVRKFYVTRLTRTKADTLLEKIVEEFPEDGLDWQVACLKSSGEPIGYTGLTHVTYDLPFTPCIEIGWLFLPEFWGNGYATEAAKQILQHGFDHHGLEEVVAFAAHNNYASIAVMEKLGMHKEIGADFEHPGIPDTFGHLNPQVLYRVRPELS